LILDIGYSILDKPASLIRYPEMFAAIIHPILGCTGIPLILFYNNASSTKMEKSSIQYPASSIQHSASSIQHPVSRLR
jgi:hypothetical protein